MTSQHSRVMHPRPARSPASRTPAPSRRNHNPDAGVTYGFRDLNKPCLSKVPKQVPAKYKGIVDTHPYSTADHGWHDVRR